MLFHICTSGSRYTQLAPVLKVTVVVNDLFHAQVHPETLECQNLLLCCGTTSSSAGTSASTSAGTSTSTSAGTSTSTSAGDSLSCCHVNARCDDGCARMGC